MTRELAVYNYHEVHGADTAIKCIDYLKEQINMNRTNSVNEYGCSKTAYLANVCALLEVHKSCPINLQISSPECDEIRRGIFIDEHRRLKKY